LVLVIEELLHEESTMRGVLYFRCNGFANSERMWSEIVKTLNLTHPPEAEDAFSILRRAFVKAYKRTEQRGLFVIDDAQRIFGSGEEEKALEFISSLRYLMEKHFCDIILVVSEGSIANQVRKASGVTIRSKVLFWPAVADADMIHYIRESKIDVDATKFVQHFDSSFGALQIVRGYNGGLDRYIQECRGLVQMKLHHLFRHEQLGQVYRDAAVRTMKAGECGLDFSMYAVQEQDILDRLVSENILRFNHSEQCYQLHNRIFGVVLSGLESGH
jgi:hypothetical protein